MSEIINEQCSDILFTLGAVGLAETTGPWDKAMVEATIYSVADFASEILAPSNSIADQQGCTLENGKVKVPAILEEAYAEYVGRGLNLLGLGTEFGGLGAPALVQLAAIELMSGTNHSFQMSVGLVPGVAEVIARNCSSESAQKYIAPMASGETLATMCLTEPDAGSDLNNIRCLATRNANGWSVSGAKIFISGGDQSMSDDILHLVLAKTGVRDDGRTALSLFAVTGSDQVSVLRIEEKLGLHASPTCALHFEKANAVLVGEEGRGLAAMFVLMNHARIDVAMQAVGHASAAFLKANEYASHRIQGRDQTGAPTLISGHGDVKRMLREMEAATLGLRCMCYLAMSGEHSGLIEFLTPVCKAFVTDRGVASVDTAIQVLGGYGYLIEYGLEQHWRDARITRIYEGTNGIMGMTLVDRLLFVKDGSLADQFAETAEKYAASAPNNIADQLRDVVGLWRKSRSLVVASENRGALAHSFLTLTGLVWNLCGWSVLVLKSEQAKSPERIRELGHYACKNALQEAQFIASQIGVAASRDRES